MLAKANRIRTGEDFRRTLRRGRKQSGEYLLVAVRASGEAPTRFGFVVSKRVGNAVERNMVKRRLRAAARDILGQIPRGYDVVVRAFPGSSIATWDSLRSELTQLTRQGRS